jgi:hypothetical protein
VKILGNKKPKEKPRHRHFWHEFLSDEVGNFVVLSGQEEGIMVKDLAAMWTPGDRKGAWMKLKPDHAMCQDIDAIIIGMLLTLLIFLCVVTGRGNLSYAGYHLQQMASSFV